MKHVRNRLIAFAAVLSLPAVALHLCAQMHRVARPDQVTRAVGVYEYVGDLQHPKAARLTPVSLFIGGHFEDAGVYLARPIPFALDGGLRYELQRAGALQSYLDVVASRNFASSASAASTAFDDGWFGYGRVVAPAAPKAARLRPNCGNAHVVQETDSTRKEDGKPHFGGKPPAGDETQAQSRGRGRSAAPDPCRDDEPERAERVSLADDTKRDSNSPDPERPTLHRSPESSAHNTGSEGKPDKKAPKPPPATITANGSPADDPDRPTIRHRTTDEDDPNALPPDPVDLASRERSRAAAKADSDSANGKAAPAAPGGRNDTVAEGATINGGDTMAGGPVLRRGRISTPSAPASPAIAASRSAGAGPLASSTATASLPAPLPAMVAVSDAKDRPAHDFTYTFASPADRASALTALQAMATAVVANPALATDAPEGTKAQAQAAPASVPAQARSANQARPANRARTAVGRGTGTVHRVASARPAATAAPSLTDETMSAYQLYYGAPVTYVYSARVPASGTAPERFVTVMAQTDVDGKLQPAMRTVTDAAHLDRIPRYRLIDVVDADGSNRGSLLMELRQQRSRQFALYRLLGSKPDQVFLSGTTLL